MRESAGWLAAAVLSGLVLSACGGSTGRNQAADTRIVLDRSIGGVSLRERRSDVERTLGPAVVVGAEDQQPPEPRLHFEDVMYSNGLEVGFVSAGAKPPALRRGRVAFLLTRSPRFRTPEGVHVGSTSDELHRIEGVTCGNLAGTDCQHGGKIHNTPGTFFKLSGPDGVVVLISIALSD